MLRVFKIGTSGNETCKAVINTSDGGFLFLAKVANPLGIIITKISSTYNFVWGKSLAGNSNQYQFSAVERIGSTGYFCVGTDVTASPTPYVLVIIDSTGSVSHARTFTGAYSF